MRRWVILVVAVLAVGFAFLFWRFRYAPAAAENRFLHWHLVPASGNRIDNYRIHLASFDANGLTSAPQATLDTHYLPAKGVVFNNSQSFGYTVMRTRAMGNPWTVMRIEASGRMSPVVDLPAQEVDAILAARGMKYRLDDVTWETQGVAVDWEGARLFTVGCIGSGESIFAVLSFKEKKWQVIDRWDEKYCLNALVYEPSTKTLRGMGWDFHDDELVKGRQVFRLTTEGKVLERLPSNIDALLLERQNRVTAPVTIQHDHERYGSLEGNLVLMYDEVEFSYNDPNHYELTRLTIHLDWNNGTAVVVPSRVNE